MHGHPHLGHANVTTAPYGRPQPPIAPFAMGYRELLKKYIRLVEEQAGDHFIDSIGYSLESRFSNRELGELRAILNDLSRDSSDEPVTYGAMPSCNYRLRLLSTCYGLTLQQAADLSGVDAHTVRRWRANPRSRHFIRMHEAEFERFEHSLFDRLPEYKSKTLGLHQI